jgi:endonuclease-3
MKPADREAFFARLAAANPDPASELTFGSPYELLVSVILSAQATDLSVNKATALLYPVANTPAAIVALGVEKLEPFIRTIGLYRTKAKNVVATSRLLIERHGGEVPRDRASLEALPGVGRKTANVVLNVAFGEHTLAVDTHVFRVSNRTGLAPGRTVEIVEDKLMQVVPKQFLFGAHHWLILHGRHVCKARVPECWRCPVADLCPYRPKTPPPGEPAPGTKRSRAPVLLSPSIVPTAKTAGKKAAKKAVPTKKAGARRKPGPTSR